MKVKLKTLKELETYFEKNKLILQCNIYNRTNSRFALQTGVVKKRFSWMIPEDRAIVVATNEIKFSIGQTSFSCAIPEFGNFKNDKKLDKHWEFLLQYFIRKYLVRGWNYFRCVTTTERGGFTALNKLLPKLGFEKRWTTTTKHGGRYKVFVWELIVK